MLEKIEHKGNVLAMIIRANHEPEGINFVTPNDYPLQLGVIKHKQGNRIKAHVHKSSPKLINDVQEVLYIVYGEIEAVFYSEHAEKVRSIILRSGDTILLVSGGHGFNILEDCKIVEIKQGPYHGIEEDKKRLGIE
ncbi:hypothetical protein ACFLTS_03875 [Chloroflexota bacterium]